MRRVRKTSGRLLARPVVRLRRGGWPALAWTARLTTAAVAAYLVARVAFPGTQPLLAPLTALLVVQVTPVGLLASGLDRAFSVVLGVSVAVAFSTAVQLTWWSLAIVIAVSLLVGQALRLRSNLIEAPISAMLILGVGSLAADSAAWQRVTETLVGAAVGVVSNLLFPPKVATEDAGVAMEGLADRLARLLERAGDTLARRDIDSETVVEEAAGWLVEARRLTHDIPNVGAALLQAEQGRRLNVRALRTPDAGPGLRQGMEALEHSAVAVRSMFRSLLDASRSDSIWPGADLGSPVRMAIAVLLQEFAGGLRAFGRLVRAEAEAGSAQPEIEQLQEAMNGLLEARARISDLLLDDVDPARSELNFALLSTVKRLLAELNLDERIRRQSDARPAPLARMRDRVDDSVKRRR